MQRKKPSPTCYHRDCDEPPYLGGLCNEHHEEKCAEGELRSAAVDCLHRSTVDETLPTNVVVREELLRIQHWWREVCNTLNYGGKHPILRDEVEYAKEWCIRLAEQLVLFERAIRGGKALGELPFMLEHTRQWVWERFENLEKGLMSNGVRRPERR